MAWDAMMDRYDSAYATATLDKCIIELNHYLRHIRHNEDYKTAQEYKSKIFKLEADARRVYQELKEKQG